jgi:amino acid adenylation domain-containing protein
VIDLQALPPEEREAEARRHFAAEATRPFDLARGPLLRVQLLRLGPAEQVVIILLHHIISDGWSMEVLVREMSALYAGFRQGHAAPLPPLPVQYADYALWQRRWLQGEALERQLAYWKEKLTGVPPTLDLPTDRPRPPVQSARGAVRWRRIPAELAATVRSLARRESATLFTTLLAAFQVLLARHTHQEDFALGSPFAGRGRLETEGLIGFFVNTLALRADLSGEPAFTDVLARARATVLEAQTHSDLPFERLVEELHPERLLDRSPIFQVMFGAQVVNQNPDGSALQLPEVQIHVLLPETMAVKFDMNVTFLDIGDAFNAGVEYSADLFDPATIDRLLDRYEVLLAAAAAAPGAPALTLPLLTADEQRQVLIEEKAAGPLPAGLLHAHFATQAERTPDAIALLQGDQRRTYRETAEAARRLARHLLALGLPPEGRVGIWRETSIDAVVALLAILEAGGAYVPLDPSYPVERLRFMAADAGLSALIVRGGADPFTDIAVPRVDLERDAPMIAARSAAPLGFLIPEEALAYVLYTSGSTGQPKGVACPHAGAVRLVDDLLRRAPLPEGAVSSIWTSLAFDVSICEVFGALAGGGQLEIPPAAVRTEGAAFASWLVERGIESAYVPPVLVPDLAARATSAAEPSLQLRRLIVGAEPVREPLLVAIACAIPGIQILNGYGPTESAIFSTFQEVGLDDGGDRNAPIGRPVAGTRAVLLDRRLEPVPPGVAGELFLSGGGLARGYLGRPDLTAERFLPDPFAGPAGNPGGRAYRTGDLALLRPDGALEFLGRTDLQVKLRGFRIELGEVEAALRACPGVRDAAAVVREDRPGDRRLVAYLAGNAETSVGDLRAILRERLPGPMVPSSFVFLETLPLTPSGKVDRRAFPVPGVSVSREGVAPRDPLERELAGIWEEVLGVRPIGVQDDFFELGGHSLLGAALMGRVRERFGHDLPVATLFRRSTVEELATVLRGGTSPAGSLVTLRADGQRPPLVLVHPVGGHALCYAPLAGLLADRPLLAFEATGRETTVEAMAERYLTELGSRSVGILGGWSMGGLVAFEMARRRAAAGHPVDLLVMFDTVAPGHQGETPSEADLLLSFAADLADRLGLGLSAELVGAVRSLDTEAGLARLLDEARRHGVPLDLDGARHLFRLFSTNEAAMRTYAGGPHEGRVALFRPEGAAHDAAAGWPALAPNLEIVPVPGDHYSLLRPPHVEVLAERLRSRLLQLTG